MKEAYDNIKENVSIVQIEDLTNAEVFLSLLHDKGIPIIGTCACIDPGNNHILRPTCDNKHIIIVSKRHSEIAFELLRSIEGDFPILY